MKEIDSAFEHIGAIAGQIVEDTEARMGKTETAGIGHNNPPEPIDEHKRAINDLYDEAKLWLDGEPVETAEQAAALNTLEDRVRKAMKEADAQRVIDQKPYKEKVDAIQADYNELIGKNKSVTGKGHMAIDAIKAALEPYLIEQDRIQREKAEAARKEAEEKQRLAMEAMRQRNAANLEQREEAERLVKEAKDADAAARKAENTKVNAKGEGRATALRTVWKFEVTDLKSAAAWVWRERRDGLLVFIEDLVGKEVRAGKRDIDGVRIYSEKVL